MVTVRKVLMTITPPPVEIGKVNELQVVSRVDFGVYLDGGDRFGEILLPKRDVPAGCRVGDTVPVFLYLDSEDRFVATTQTPYAMAGELACLRVVATTAVGAFLDWGLPKDLLVPFREQKQKMVEGRFYPVYVYFDNSSQRMVASSKVYKHIPSPHNKLQEGDQVDLIVCTPFEHGIAVIVNKSYMGAIYKNEVFEPWQPGERIGGFVKKIRDDDKIDITLRRPGDHKQRKSDLAVTILARLKEEDGFLAVTDKSSPEEIRKMFGVSKKGFKEAVGHLYKLRAIRLEKDGIWLVKRG
ncbi:MAG: S1 RNA-binding domain-containing protein [Chitinivibrionales bacterium]